MSQGKVKTCVFTCLGRPYATHSLCASHAPACTPQCLLSRKPNGNSSLHYSTSPTCVCFQSVSAALVEAREEARAAGAALGERLAGAEERARRLEAASGVRDALLTVGIGEVYWGHAGCPARCGVKALGNMQNDMLPVGAGGNIVCMLMLFFTNTM